MQNPVILHRSSILELELLPKDGEYFLNFKVNKFKHSNKEEYEKLCKDLHMIYVDFASKGIKFAQIYDLKNAKVSNVVSEIQFVKKFASFLEEHEDIITNYCHATCILIETQIIRTIVNSLMGMYVNKRPVEVRGSYEDAHVWLWSIINPTPRPREILG